MPICKRLPVHNQVHLANLTLYLLDSEHPSHQEHDVRRGRVFGDLSPSEFIQKAYQQAERINQSKAGRSGAKLKTLAHFFVGRFADGTFLDEEEENEYEAGIVACLAPDDWVLCYRHFNWLTGSIDFNFIVSSTISNPPRIRFGSTRNIWDEMTRVSDTITDELNRKRKAQGRTLIYTMKDQKSSRAPRKGEKWIQHEVAQSSPSETLNFEDLLRLLERLGHNVTKWNHDQNRISIIPRDKKRPIRCNLDDLWDAALAAQNIEQPELGIDKSLTKNAVKFGLDKDKQVESVLEIKPPRQTRSL